jgi:hypothetical protein
MEHVQPGLNRSNRYVKILLRVLGAAVLLILLIWTGVYIYFRLNKQKLMDKVTTTVNEKLEGEVTIADIGLNFIVNFPSITLRLDGVTLRDSMYKVHQHDMLKARKIFISASTFQLISGKVSPSRIVLEDAQIYLFTDGNGYTNRYLVNRREDGTKRPASRTLPDRIILDDVRITLYNVPKRKLHDFYVRKLNCKISSSGGQMNIKTKVDALVKDMAFNLEKGSYLKGKNVRGDFRMQFDTLQKMLNIKNAQLKIGGESFALNAGFRFDSTHNFTLQLASNSIAFRQVASLLPRAISKKLDSVDFSKPLALDASIAGRTVYRDTPVVKINWTVVDNRVHTPQGDFENSSFSGSFTNQVSDTLTRNDANSALTITGLKTDWEGIPLVSEKIIIANLLHPVVTCDLQSNTDLSKLDEVLGSESFHFIKGDARTKIYYHGPVGDSTKVSPYISGSFSFNNAEMEYIPRGIKLTGFNGDIIFDSSDIRLKGLKGKVQQHAITINAEIKNFFSLMDIDPGKLELTSSIYMPELDVQEFRSLLGSRKKSTRKAGKARLAKLSNSIDKFMDMCNMNTSLQADRVKYKRFVANDVKGTVLLTNNSWRFNNISLRHADGTLNLNAGLGNMQSDVSNLSLDAKLQSINISKLFEAFNNFGMDDIDKDNIKGILTTNIQLSGLLNSKAELLPSSLNGTIDLSLQKGELINFEPLQKMSFFLLKKRDFSNLEFAELKNRFELKGRYLVINRMEVQSTALSMYVEGLYDLRGDSTDLVIQVPLSNLKKRKPDYEPENKGVNAKTGMSVYVRAKSGKGDEIDFKVGLFKRKSPIEKKGLADPTSEKP